MNVKRALNSALSRATGFELVRVRYTKDGKQVKRLEQAERLLQAPVFLLSSVRSGSTLLRMMLGSHSQLYAPHELHLIDVQARLASWYSETSMSELGLDKEELTDLLWDRLLDVALRRSGKPILVDKTPSNLFIYERIARNWRDARFIFLLRHPASIYQSWHSARSQWSQEEAVQSTLKYVTKLEEARHKLSGIDVRYEDLTADPEKQTRRLCAHLDLPWEPEMIDYGANGHQNFRRGLGDWSGKIQSGKPQASRPLPKPDEIPKELRDICRVWGYLTPQDVKR